MNDHPRPIRRFFCCFPIGTRPSRRNNNRVLPSSSHVSTRAFTGFTGNLSNIDGFGGYSHSNTLQFIPKKLARINTMFTMNDLVCLEFKSPNYKEIKYNCPICFCFFNKILETSCCRNYICHGCAAGLNHRILINIKVNTVVCPFCSKEDLEIIDVDPQKEVKSYSDTPNKSQTGQNPKLDELRDILEIHIQKSRFSKTWGDFAPSESQLKEKGNKDENNKEDNVAIGFNSDGFLTYRGPITDRDEHEDVVPKERPSTGHKSPKKQNVIHNLSSKNSIKVKASCNGSPSLMEKLEIKQETQSQQVVQDNVERDQLQQIESKLESFGDQAVE